MADVTRRHGTVAPMTKSGAMGSINRNQRVSRRVRRRDVSEVW
jgi:hypothetical protein